MNEEIVETETTETEGTETSDPVDPQEGSEGSTETTVQEIYYINDPIGVYDLDRTKETIFYTPSGDIHVKHEITLGDVATITLLATLIIFFILDRVIRR